MIGQTIECRSPFPVSAVVGVIFGLIFLIAAALETNFHLLLIGIAPLLIGISLWMSRPSGVVFTLEDDRLVPFDVRPPIPYASITAIALERASSLGSGHEITGPFQIIHSAGRLLIPRIIDISPGDLYHFLAERIPRAPARKVHVSLKEHVDAQVEKFGVDKVQLIHARDPRIQFQQSGYTSAIGKALLITGVLWFALPIAYAENTDRVDDAIFAWLGFGFASVFLGIALWIRGRTSRRRHAAGFGTACLVVSPTGIAVRQQDMQGHLRWDEITGIKNGSARFLGTSKKEGLNLNFAGGNITLLDVYERPLAEIASAIMKNIRHPM